MALEGSRPAGAGRAVLGGSPAGAGTGTGTVALGGCGPAVQ